MQLEIVDVLSKSDLALKRQVMRPHSPWGEVLGRNSLSRRTKPQAASDPSLNPDAHEAEGRGFAFGICNACIVASMHFEQL